MPALLDEVLAANGGLARWRRVHAVAAHVRLSGTALQPHCPVRDVAQSVVVVDTRRQHAVLTPFGRPSDRLVYSEGTVRVEGGDGNRLPLAPDEESSARLLAESLWLVFNLPFALAAPGVLVADAGVEPAASSAPVPADPGWGGVHAAFTADIAGLLGPHLLYYDGSGRLHRHDYLTDAVPFSRLCSDQVLVDDVWFPTTNRLFRRDPFSPRQAHPLVVLEIDGLQVG